MTKQNVKDVKDAADLIYGSEAAEKLLKQKYKDSASEFFDPVPDVIGYKQHAGECASDSIQEMLLFADGLREYSQPIIHGITKEQITTRSGMKLEYDDWALIQEYLFYAQKRFRAHYAVINYLREHKIDPQTYYDKHEEVCLLNPLFKQKEATSIEAGILALKHYKQQAVYKEGLYNEQSKKLIDSLLKCLCLPFVKTSGVDIGAAAIFVASKTLDVNKDGQEELGYQGHATSFFKMMGSWVYYDDNIGFIVVNEKVIEALKDATLRIVTYGQVYFVRKVDERYESVFVDGKWDKDAAAIFYKDGKLKEGLHLYRPYKFYSVVHNPDLLIEDSIDCGISSKELDVKSVDQLISTLTKFRTCIYANLKTNSKIFEKMYKFLYEHIELVKKDPDTLDFVEKSVKNVVTRPACSPLTHYWCSKIKMALLGTKADSLSWFKLPKVTRLGQPRLRWKEQPAFQKRLDDGVNAAESRSSAGPRSLTPCLPGQIRNTKTLKCKDREPRKPKERGSIKSENGDEEVKEKPVREKCPKGEVRDKETGDCVPKQQPCPPGQVRDKESGDCRGRLDKNRCPEGQIFDKKTKKCRDQKAFKF